MKKITLNNVTLLSVSSVKIPETIFALKKSMKKINFAEVLLLTNEKPEKLPPNIKYVHIDKIDDIEQFNYFMIFELYKYVNTDFILQVHYDGYVVHPELWRDDFLKYDYIGSPWPATDGYKDSKGNYSRVGNSVGIRSYRLLEFPSKANIPFDKGQKNNEDGFICCTYKHLFEAEGMKFAPFDVAKHFGKELEFEDNKDIKKTFLFHKWRKHNVKYLPFKKKIAYYLHTLFDSIRLVLRKTFIYPIYKKIKDDIFAK